jgi:hypothetical protein
MPSESMKCTAGVTLDASVCSDRQPPPWFAEALVLLRHLGRQGFWKKLESVQVARQCKDFEICDFVIVLVAYAVSNEKGLRAFYAAVAPVAAVLMAVCGRDRMPSPSALSQFLAAVEDEAIESLRTLFCPNAVWGSSRMDFQQA